MIGISIIARLNAFPNHAIAAGRWSAGTQTLIGLDIVTIITALPILQNAIAAARRLAVVAVIGGVIVTVIAALARSKQTIAAARLNAVTQTPIGVLAVTVITSLKSGVIFL